MSIKTVLFDLDGTLLDTNELILASFRHTFDMFGHAITEEEMKHYNGPPLRESFQTIDPENVEGMVRTYREFNLKYHDDYVELFPGVIRTLDQLAQKQIPMAIVTNKVRNAVEKGLSLTGLDDYFTPETVITLDDVNHSKPHPESVLKALQHLQSQAEHTLIVGDNYHDIQAGHNAGVKTAGVDWSEKGREYLKTFEPTYMLNEMSDLLRLV